MRYKGDISEAAKEICVSKRIREEKKKKKNDGMRKLGG